MSDPKIYLAGPFFNANQKFMVSHLAEVIEACKYNLYSPWRDAGELGWGASTAERARTFQRDVDEIETCDLVVSVLDWSVPGGYFNLDTHMPDPGTVWEIGYAYCSHKPVISVSEDEDFSSIPISLMLTESILAHAQGSLQLRKILTVYRPVARRAADETYGEVVGKIRAEFPLKLEVI